MRKKSQFSKFVVAITLAAMLAGAMPADGQSLIPVSDVTGSSGIFVLRKTTPRTFAPARLQRSKSQRMETARKVTRQYTTLAKVAPRRTRTEAVNPNDPRLKTLQRMPKDQASRLFAGVGEYYMDRDNYNQAIDFFREALQMDASNTVAQMGLSEALALKGNELLVKDSFPASQTFFREALSYNPKNAPAYFGLAEVLSEMAREDLQAGRSDEANKRETEAAENYEKALANDKDLSEIYTPLGALYYQQKNIAKADEYLTKAVAASPTDPQAQFYFGLVRHSQGKDAEALAALKKSTLLDATNPDAFYYHGESLRRQGNFKDAVTEYEKATALKADHFDAWFGLGAAHYELGNFQAAVDAYTRATRLRNDNYEAYNNLGDAFRQLPDYNKAEANYNLAAMFVQRRPSFSREDAADMYSKAAFSIAKQCELNLKQKLPCRWDAAIAFLEQAAALNTTGVDNANLGWAYYNSARADINRNLAAQARPKLEKARQHLQSYASGNGNFATGPMLNLGMALTDLGEYGQAVEVLEKVVKKEPKWAFALNELGIAYRKQDKFKDAASNFKKATEKDKDFAQAYYNWGEAEFKAGNIGEARKVMETLKKLNQGLAAQLDAATNGGLRSRG